MQALESLNKCQKHQKPFQSMCRTRDCSCSILLCEICTEDHRKKVKNSETIKIYNYNYQMSVESDIALKQYSSLMQEFSSKAETQLNDQMFKTSMDLKILESVMLVMTEDKNKYHQLLRQFGNSHGVVFKSLKQLKESASIEYFKELIGNCLIQALLHTQKAEGLQKFKKRVKQLYYSLSKFQQFLKATQKYGKNIDEFQSQILNEEILIKQQIKNLLGMKSTLKFKKILSQKANIISEEQRKGSVQKPRIKEEIKSPCSQQNFANPPRKRIFTNNVI